MSAPRHWLDRMLLCDEVASEVSEYLAEKRSKK